MAQCYKNDEISLFDGLANKIRKSGDRDNYWKKT